MSAVCSRPECQTTAGCAHRAIIGGVQMTCVFPNAPLSRREPRGCPTPGACSCPGGLEKAAQKLWEHPDNRFGRDPVLQRAVEAMDCASERVAQLESENLYVREKIADYVASNFDPSMMGRTLDDIRHHLQKPEIE